MVSSVFHNDFIDTSALCCNATWPGRGGACLVGGGGGGRKLFGLLRNKINNSWRSTTRGSFVQWPRLSRHHVWCGMGGREGVPPTCLLCRSAHIGCLLMVIVVGGLTLFSVPSPPIQILRRLPKLAGKVLAVGPGHTPTCTCASRSHPCPTNLNPWVLHVDYFIGMHTEIFPAHVCNPFHWLQLASKIMIWNVFGSVGWYMYIYLDLQCTMAKDF